MEDIYLVAKPRGYYPSLTTNTEYILKLQDNIAQKDEFDSFITALITILSGANLAPIAQG